MHDVVWFIDNYYSHNNYLVLFITRHNKRIIEIFYAIRVLRRVEALVAFLTAQRSNCTPPRLP
jgi:hypothetical protein